MALSHTKNLFSRIARFSNTNLFQKNTQSILFIRPQYFYSTLSKSHFQAQNFHTLSQSSFHAFAFHKNNVILKNGPENFPKP